MKAPPNSEAQRFWRMKATWITGIQCFWRMKPTQNSGSHRSGEDEGYLDHWHPVFLEDETYPKQ
jgi:hypothetical protein